MPSSFAVKLNETLVRATTPAGLKITILPKPGFHKTELHLAVGFGSLDEDGEQGVGGFPRGTAHFLEHMLFENDAADPSDAFAKIGAQVNAYTAPDVTDYYFSTTDDWRGAAELLFRLVTTPQILASGVAKEKEIIAREIQMYEDDVNDLFYEELLNALYRKHPVAHPIAGTVASIKAIDEAVLKAAHAAYYVPSNMHLLVVGDVDPAAVIGAATSHPDLQSRAVRPRLLQPGGGPQPREASVRKKKDIKNDMLMLGVKFDRPTTKTCFENDVEEIAWAFLFDSIFGKASPNYQALVRKGLVNEAFDATAQCEPDYGHIVVYTETKKPAAAAKALWNLFDTAADRLDPVRFETAKRRLVGNYIQTFNSVSAIAGFVLDYELEGVDVFALIEAIDEDHPGRRPRAASQAVGGRPDDDRLPSLKAAPAAFCFSEGGGNAPSVL
ncbi:MAG: insulinase family protein [Bacillus subtilis]|nr:insulinase family protein [Bacillus subtilis]